MQKAADEAAAAASSIEGVKPPKDKDKAIKELIKSIPRERKDVFAYSLKWDAFDANTDAILPKLSKWVHTHLTHPLSLAMQMLLHVWSHTGPTGPGIFHPVRQLSGGAGPCVLTLSTSRMWRRLKVLASQLGMLWQVM